MAICTNFQSPLPFNKRLYTKFEENWTRGFRGEVVQKCKRRADERRTDGKWSQYLILRLRWAKNTKHTSVIPARYLVRPPIQTYVRLSRLGSETCKIHGGAKRLTKSSLLQTERIWRRSLMHFRQHIVPKAQEPPHSLVQMELVFWLTKKLFWKRLAEHSDGVLNRLSYINDEAINRLSQAECNPLLDEFPTVSETSKAIKLLSSGKAPDAIHIEIYKAGGPPVAEKLKRKGNSQVGDNHRGISLSSITGKILVRVLLNRLNEHLDQSGLLPECQCGFRKDRRTIDMIFTARQLPENKMWTSTWPLSALPKHLIQSWGILENYDSLAIRPSS